MKRALAILLLPLLASASGCVPAPYGVTNRTVAATLAPHFDQVFAPATHVGVLRPRFGAPELVQRGQPFSLLLLERGASLPQGALIAPDLDERAAQRCLTIASARCAPLVLTSTASEPVSREFTLHSWQARFGALPAGIYDVWIDGERLPRAVVITDDDPARPRDLRVVQLSDLHVGKGGHTQEIDQRLAATVAAVNRLAPDLVIVTGDMAEQGRELRLEEAAGRALLKLNAPLFAILGNHDYGHFPQVLHPSQSDAGYYNFARVFHPLRFWQAQLGGWRFVGFDSGPSLFSLRITTRGLLPETVALIGQAIDEAAALGQGVVLFSHAPTRAEIDSNPAHTGSNGVGSMRQGAHQLEAREEAAARRGQPILHLAGHTHWADVFVSDGAEIRRIPFAQLRCTLSLTSPFALINAPSTTEQTFHHIEHGELSGFVVLTLRAHDRSARYVLHDRPTPDCPASADDAALIGY